MNTENNMTNLVLQGLGDCKAQLQQLAALAGVTGTTSSRWLSDTALRCEGVVLDDAQRRNLATAALAAKVDITYDAAQRKMSDFKLVAMDMDSTLITIECIDEIADMFGVKPQVAAITARSMAGELDFAASLRERVALLEGLPVDALARVYDERLTLMPGARELLADCRASGIRTLLISGGFTYFTDRLKEELGLDYAIANQLEIIDGKLTGRMTGPLIDAQAKADWLVRLRGELGLEPEQVIAMGDGANDLKMIAAAGLGVGMHPKPVVRQHADVSLRFVGLDGLSRLFA